MKTHGHSVIGKVTTTYRAWQAMKARCYSRNAEKYAAYGGRGIRVCKRWLDSFAAFLADMGERPAGMTLERKDTNGHYEPGNCRWATQKEQCRNKRNNKRLTHRGKTMTVIEWAEKYRLSANMLYKRIRRGWPDSLVLAGVGAAPRE